ncbi:Rrf2 family transcriptional regulator [Aquimarina gracilis]|uniref:Rrf2 family transcriptional regulator n=1 Tax=Aquimarina gracilis TaxID=874422 RepID=A0ABU5ZTC4_9FLAO|nr:Rrf2 family transcriptional regulator [Aquimarina gracilis]MEB3345279.1 Rrf2 family transcriptional regulator [Aquimarina gracilis]
MYTDNPSMFSKSCEYGLRAVIFIAQQTTKNNKVSLTTVSEEIDSPQAFTAKVLQQLTKNNIVKSIKGPYGGFVIEDHKMDTKLSEVVSVLDGDSIYTGCGLGLKQCDAKSPCPLHNKFVAIRNDLRNMLENNSLRSLAADMNADLAILKR